MQAQFNVMCAPARLSAIYLCLCVLGCVLGMATLMSCVTSSLFQDFVLIVTTA